MKYELPAERGDGTSNGGRENEPPLAARVGMGVGAVVVIALLFGFARSSYQPQSRQVAPIVVADNGAASGADGGAPIAALPAVPNRSPGILAPAAPIGGGIAPASTPYLPPPPAAGPSVPGISSPAAAVMATRAAEDTGTVGGRVPASVRGLRDAFIDVQKFDREVAWGGNGVGATRLRAALQDEGSAPSNATPSAERGVSEEPDASAPSVYDQLDALAVTVALNGHPGRFPAPLRKTAGEAAGELRVYLKNAEAAQSATSDAQREALRTAAAAHLTRAGQLTARLQDNAIKKN